MSILTRNICGVYEIVNIINGHRYIGSAVDIKKRWSNHQCLLRSGRHHNPYLQSAWNKYGAACFRFSVIEYHERDLLVEREQFYIDFFKPEYNIAPKAGRSFLGRRHSEETRHKISKALKGKFRSEEARKRMSEADRGRTRSQEVRRRISEMLQGITRSKETRKKMSEARKGKSSWSKGKTFSKEHRRKLSEAAKRREAKKANDRNA